MEQEVDMPVLNRLSLSDKLGAHILFFPVILQVIRAWDGSRYYGM